MAPKSARQQEAADRYLRESVDEFKIRVPKGKKAVIKAYAQAQGQSLNKYVEDAIDARMAQEAVPSTHEQ